MAITLPPDVNPTVFSVTLGVKIAPYFRKWYTDNALPAETPSEFLVRQIGPSVIDYVARLSANAEQATLKAALETINAEAQAIKVSL